MKKWILPLALIAAMLSSVSQAQYTVYGGGGVVSCDYWTAERKADGFEAIAMETWIAGFVSGYGFSGSTPLKETDTIAIFAHIDNYCGANPPENLAAAAADLIQALKK